MSPCIRLTKNAFSPIFPIGGTWSYFTIYYTLDSMLAVPLMISNVAAMDFWQHDPPNLPILKAELQALDRDEATVHWIFKYLQRKSTRFYP